MICSGVASQRRTCFALVRNQRRSDEAPLLILLIAGATGPHSKGRFLHVLRVPIAETRIKPAVVAFRDMPLVRMLRIRAIIKVSRTKSGIVPRINLFQAPDLKSIGVPVTNSDRSGSVLDV